jgi:imidazolonepropionase-like amidohydrolase
LPPDLLAKARDLLEVTAGAFRTALAHGVPLAAGTDGGVPTQRHGMVWRELATMVELGCPAEDALRAGTAAGADVTGVGDTVGRIRPGARVDLIAVPGDPRAGMAVLRRPLVVILGGVPLAGGEAEHADEGARR